MPFEPGNKIGRGRPKGMLNRRSLEFLQVLEDCAFDPGKALIETHREAMRMYQESAEDKAGYYLRIAFDSAKELASYAYPKLKSIEQSKPNPLEGMTPEQKLEAMRQAVKIMEGEVKK